MKARHFGLATHTLAAGTADLPDWHRQRDRYAVWLLRIDTASVLARWRSARRHLNTFLLPDQQRQAHITLFACGFPARHRRWDDDFPDSALAEQKARLQALQLSSFELQIGGLDSFSSAAFLEIHDPEQALPSLRSALNCIPEQRFAPYVPHLTVGLYAAAFPAETVIRQLQSFPETQPLRLQVRDVCLATYAARELGSPLRVEYRHRLSDK